MQTDYLMYCLARYISSEPLRTCTQLGVLMKGLSDTSMKVLWMHSSIG